MDYAPGGTLLDYVQQRKRLREPLARWFFQQLIIAVDYW
jgi:serine/threonine-protein kinase SRK2